MLTDAQPAYIAVNTPRVGHADWLVTTNRVQGAGLNCIRSLFREKHNVAVLAYIPRRYNLANNYRTYGFGADRHDQFAGRIERDREHAAAVLVIMRDAVAHFTPIATCGICDANAAVAHVRRVFHEH